MRLFIQTTAFRTSLAGAIALAMLTGFATNGFSQKTNAPRQSAKRQKAIQWICKYREREGNRRGRDRQRVFTGARARQNANQFARRLQARGIQARVYPVIRRPQPQPSRFTPDHLVGKPLWLAIKIAKIKGYVIRVVSKDGEGMIGTHDYRTDRINVDVKRGKVVRARIG